MDRRQFLRGLVGGVAVASVAAAVPQWPFRVYSFPRPSWVSYRFKFTVTPPPARLIYYDKQMVELLRSHTPLLWRGVQTELAGKNAFLLGDL